MLFNLSVHDFSLWNIETCTKIVFPHFTAHLEIIKIQPSERFFHAKRAKWWMRFNHTSRFGKGSVQ